MRVDALSSSYLAEGVPILPKKTIRPKFIVLDSNVLISDYWLRSPSFLLLREFLGRAKATLVVPKIVLEEVVNHHREDLAKLKSEIRDTVREAGRLLRNVKGSAKWWVEISKTDSADPYEKFLSAELAAMKAKVPDYANIPHADVVSRDLRRRKPFQQSGKGYRDALLWETIVRRYVAAKALTIFVGICHKEYPRLWWYARQPACRIVTGCTFCSQRRREGSCSL